MCYCKGGSLVLVMLLTEVLGAQWNLDTDSQAEKKNSESGSSGDCCHCRCISSVTCCQLYLEGTFVSLSVCLLSIYPKTVSFCKRDIYWLGSEQRSQNKCKNTVSEHALFNLSSQQ